MTATIAAQNRAASASPRTEAEPTDWIGYLFVAFFTIPFLLFNIAPIFFGALATAFVGAMIITLSHTAPDRQLALKDLVSRLAESTWLYAVPIPIFYALSGTLVGRWFKGCDPTAVIAVNFVTSAAVLVPAALVLDRIWPGAPASKKPARKQKRRPKAAPKRE